MRVKRECLEVFVLHKIDEYVTKRLIILRNYMIYKHEVE